MSPQDFINKLLPYAKNDLGFDPGIVLTQAALESGWGEHAPGNMYFGIKDTDGVNGNEQLVETFEYSRRAGLTPQQIGLHSIKKVEPVTINGQKYFKYTGDDYFRKYDTPAESFKDHLQFFLKNGIYAKAVALYKTDPENFFKAIAAAGYAQSPTYAETLISIYRTIKPYIK